MRAQYRRNRGAVKRPQSTGSFAGASLATTPCNRSAADIGYTPLHVSLGDTTRRESGPDRLANELIRRIFVGEYAAGERLPPDRQLAVDLDTDRTSLRIALAQLKRMNLLRVVQGSGTMVKDFRRHAGVEFLLHVFQLKDTPAEPALQRQMFEYFQLTMPGVWALVARRASNDELDEVEAIYAEQVERAADVEAMTELSVRAVDRLAELSGNSLFPLIFRSTRPVRLRLLRGVFASVDRRASAAMNVEWVRQVRSGAVPLDQVEASFRRLTAPVFQAWRGKDAGDRDRPGSAGACARLPASVASAAMERTRVVSPDRLADELIRRIYTGEYPPGFHIPPERDLAPVMGTNRTSLRMALAQIKRMNLISAVQGSGMVVKDWRRHAGIDFLAHAVPLSGEEPDDGLVLDVIDYLNATVPSVVGAAARRRTAGGLDRIEAACLATLAHADDADACAEMAVQTQDLVAESTGNLIVALVYRSTRPLRVKQMKQVVRFVDMRARARAYLDVVQMLRGQSFDPDAVEDLFRAFQKRMYRDAIDAYASTRATDGAASPPAA